MWQLSIVYLATISTKDIVFYLSSLKSFGLSVDRRYHQLVRTWKTRKKSDFGLKFHNLSNFEINFSNASDLEIKKLHRVRFWFKSFTKRQILDWKNYNALDFELKFFDVWDFEKMSAIKSQFLALFTPWRDIISVFRAFPKSWSWIENLIACWVSKSKKNNASDFEF